MSPEALDRKRAYNRAWMRADRRANPAKYYARNRVWAIANPDKVREYHRQSRKRRPESYHQNSLRWRAKNPDARASFCAARRAKRRAAGGTFNRFEWAALKEKYNHICLKCLETKPLTIDHVIPIDLGGRHSVENIQPLCLECNSSKGVQVIDYRPDGWYLE
ncbi:MAG: hypothetical protein C5B44_05745 [Acidobacteria bacterium]|nr:MAG: hypothetical protein C5B44_05745 [Acidobacteriota bacterium]